MTKVDKTLREVRRWKAEVSRKTRRMKPAEAAAYFHAASCAAKESAAGSPLRRRAQETPHRPAA